MKNDDSCILTTTCQLSQLSNNLFFEIFRVSDVLRNRKLTEIKLNRKHVGCDETGPLQQPLTEISLNKNKMACCDEKVPVQPNIEKTSNSLRSSNFDK